MRAAALVGSEKVSLTQSAGQKGATLRDPLGLLCADASGGPENRLRFPHPP